MHEHADDMEDEDEDESDVEGLRPFFNTLYAILLLNFLLEIK